MSRCTDVRYFLDGFLWYIRSEIKLKLLMLK